MQNDSNKNPETNISATSAAGTTPRQYFKLQRFEQITDSHCGPATLQMLLSNLGISTTQPEVATAGGAENFIEMHGMRVDQLAQAVQKLAPQVQFWYKEHATLDDLRQLINVHQSPVGVEWQGIFDEDGDDAPDPEPDYGHYSIVTHIDDNTGHVVVVDPYKQYAQQDRVFEESFFEGRWYDWNEVTDPATGEAQPKQDYHMLFIVTNKDETYPAQLDMVRG